MLEDIKKTLWARADKLRANVGAAEYKHLTTTQTLAILRDTLLPRLISGWRQLLAPPALATQA